MPKKTKSPEYPSVEEIQAQLAELEAYQSDLQAALRERSAADFSAFVDELREQISARGYRLNDVLTRLRPGRGRRSVERVKLGEGQRCGPGSGR